MFHTFFISNNINAIIQRSSSLLGATNGLIDLFFFLRYSVVLLHFLLILYHF